ncbi:MAG: hypothetical protein V4474_03695 [Patescibacteria group bacterium]
MNSISKTSPEAVLPPEIQHNFGKQLREMYSEVMSSPSQELRAVLAVLAVVDKDALRAPLQPTQLELPPCWDIRDLLENNPAAKRAFFWEIFAQFPELYRWFDSEDGQFYPMMEILSNPRGGHISPNYLEKMGGMYLVGISKSYGLKEVQDRLKVILDEVRKRHGQLTAGMVSEIMATDMSGVAEETNQHVGDRLRRLVSEGRKPTHAAMTILRKHAPALAVELGCECCSA